MRALAALLVVFTIVPLASAHPSEECLVGVPKDVGPVHVSCLEHIDGHSNGRFTTVTLELDDLRITVGHSHTWGDAPGSTRCYATVDNHVAGPSRVEAGRPCAGYWNEALP